MLIRETLKKVKTIFLIFFCHSSQVLWQGILHLQELADPDLNSMTRPSACIIGYPPPYQCKMQDATPKSVN